jgi:hypothetical protein
MIDFENAKLVGEGKWFKDSAYQVYESGGRYYAVVVVGSMNKELMEETLIEIKFEDIEKYI